MALGENQIFQWKSKATQAKELEEYEKWAFPYGEKQRENLEKLLLEMHPRQKIAMLLIPFLTCKELYEGVLKKYGSRDAAVDMLVNQQRKYKGIIKKKEMTTYLALVLADAEIDESCQYPQAETVIARVKEIESLRRDGK